MTNNFQRSFSKSAVSEVFPKHLGCLPLLFQKLLPINTTVSPCHVAKLVLPCLQSSLISAYEARRELEESLNLCGVKLPLEFHKQDEYIWAEIQWE